MATSFSESFIIFLISCRRLIHFFHKIEKRMKMMKVIKNGLFGVEQK